MIETLGNSGLLWATRPRHIRYTHPRFAQIIGAARTIRMEMLVDFATCEVDDMSSSLGRIVDIFARFQKREEDESLKPEFEYDIEHGTVNFSCLIPYSMQDELTANLKLPEDQENDLRTELTAPGRLTNLKRLSCEPKTLSTDEVEVEVHAAGLNFQVSGYPK